MHALDLEAILRFLDVVKVELVQACHCCQLGAWELGQWRKEDSVNDSDDILSNEHTSKYEILIKSHLESDGG